MSAYEITGILNPDAMTPDTGEPAGTYNGHDYWTWTNDAGTWYLWGKTIGGFWHWIISATLDDQINSFFRIGLANIVGDYAPQGGATGTAAVAEYVEESTSSSSSSSSSSTSTSSVSESSVSSSSSSKSSGSSGSSSSSPALIDHPDYASVGGASYSSLVGSFGSMKSEVEYPT